MKNLNYYTHQNTLAYIYIYMLIFKILLYLENLEKKYIYTRGYHLLTNKYNNFI